MKKVSDKSILRAIETLRPVRCRLRECTYGQCGWWGLDIETVHQPHDSEALLCPLCRDTTETLL